MPLPSRAAGRKGDWASLSFYRQLIFLAVLAVVLVAVLGLRVAPVVLGATSRAADAVAPKEEAAPVLRIEWGPPGNARQARLDVQRARLAAAGSPAPEARHDEGER